MSTQAPVAHASAALRMAILASYCGAAGSSGHLANGRRRRRESTPAGSRFFFWRASSASAPWRATFALTGAGRAHLRCCAGHASRLAMGSRPANRKGWSGYLVPSCRASGFRFWCAPTRSGCIRCWRRSRCRRNSCYAQAGRMPQPHSQPGQFRRIRGMGVDPRRLAVAGTMGSSRSLRSGSSPLGGLVTQRIQRWDVSLAFLATVGQPFWPDVCSGSTTAQASAARCGCSRSATAPRCCSPSS